MANATDDKDTKTQPTNGTPPTAGDNGANGANGVQTPKTFTQEEVNAVLGKRLSEQEERLTKKFGEIVTTERTEAEKRAKMSAEEQQKAELDKQKKELEEGKVQLALGQNKLNAVTKLSELGIPVSFADYLVTPNTDETAERMQTFAKAWQLALGEAVKKELAGKTPTDLSTQKPPTDQAKGVKSYF
jgi:hypothetical protein